MIPYQTLLKLNAPTPGERLSALDEALVTADFPPVEDRYINNHIHTTFSFSPYSPTAAIYAARAEGLSTAGIVDHDSTAGAREFLEAAKRAGIPATVGMEVRASLAGTPFFDRRLNCPDQNGIAYVTIQGIPHENIGKANDFFAPCRERRNERTAAMTDSINALTKEYGISMSFERDVLPLSEYKNGGGVTERHLMYALARKLTEKAGRGEPLISLLGRMGVSLSAKQTALLSDTGYTFYEYDLLGILKGAFLPQVYIPAGAECLPIAGVAEFSRGIGAVMCYAYLGDVTDSVTGDKKAQTFEDAYIDELFAFLKDAGIPGVTYMPTRNTRAQLERIRALADRLGLLQVCGEDVNSPRQSFIVRAMDDPMFKNLIDSTWLLIDNENGKRKINY